jgi:hypothetical protein
VFKVVLPCFAKSSSTVSAATRRIIRSKPFALQKVLSLGMKFVSRGAAPHHLSGQGQDAKRSFKNFGSNP